MGFIVQQFNANVKPYLMQFIQDLKTVAGGLLTDALPDDSIVAKEQQRFFTAADEAVQHIKEPAYEEHKISSPGGKSEAPHSGRRSAAVELRQEVVSALETNIKIGTDHIRNIGDAANVARYLADYANEQAILIVTDKNDKVLAILKHTRWLTNQLRVDHVTVAGQALNVKI